MLASVEGIGDLCLTTNASMLSEQIEGLATAGLKRINVSIDTLDPDKFKKITVTKEGDDFKLDEN